MLATATKGETITSAGTVSANTELQNLKRKRREMMDSEEGERMRIKRVESSKAARILWDDEVKKGARMKNKMRMRSYRLKQLSEMLKKQEM